MSHATYDGACIIGRPGTLSDALLFQAQTRPQALAFSSRELRLTLGSREQAGWHDLTWAELDQLVTELAGGLEVIGLEAGDAVLLLTESSGPALLMQLAVGRVGAAYVLAPDDTEPALLSSLASTIKPNLVVAPTSALANVVAEEVTALGVGLDDGFASLIECGRATGFDGAYDLNDLEFASAYARPDDGEWVIASVRPGAQTYQGACLAAVGLLSEKDVLLTWTSTVSIMTEVLVSGWLVSGCKLAVESDPTKLTESLARHEPTLVGGDLVASEHLYIALYEYGREAGVWSGSAEQGVAELAEAAQLRASGWRLAASLAKRLDSLRSFGGSRLRTVLCDGGVPRHFGQVLQLLDVSARGALTSPAAGLVAVDTSEQPHLGAYGRPLPYSDIKANADGYLCIRGPGVNESVTGTWPTAGHVRGAGKGWQNTGVRGLCLDEGYVAPEGALGAPTEADTEEALQDLPEAPAQTDPAIDQAFLAALLGSDSAPRSLTAKVVVPDSPSQLPPVLTAVPLSAVPELGFGDGINESWACEVSDRFVRLCAPARRLFITQYRACRVALVALDPEATRQWAQTYQVVGANFAELAATSDCFGFVQACVQALNSRLPKPERIQQFAILDHPLADPRISRGELLDEYRVLVEQLADSTKFEMLWRSTTERTWQTT